MFRTQVSGLEESVAMGSTPAVDEVLESRSRRPRLVQKRAAALLAIGMLAVPGVPVTAAQLLAADPWDVPGEAQVELTTDEGSEVVVPSPPGWDVLQSGDGVSYRSGEARIAVQAYDRDDRELDAVAKRLMRIERLAGVNAALTGENIATDDSALSGQKCVLVGSELIGSCAFVADDDVIVWIQVMGTVDDPAPELSDVVRPITRAES
jgi:hypothetical protein